MDKEEYAALVKKKSANPKIFDNALISFLIGGVAGAIYQIIVTWSMDLFEISDKVATGYACIAFILFAIILTGAGVFDNLVSKFKFGLIIPITGFAHSVASSLMDFKKDGLITGLGSNMFKLAGSVILYGMVSAVVCALIKVIIYG